nr:site-specific integrase [uncultured Cetobacterium sp.]
MKLLEEFLEYKKQSRNIKSETIEMYQIDMRDFINFFDGRSLLQIEQSDIIHYIEFLKKRYQPNSITRKISSLKSFYRYLAKKELVEIIPTDGIILEKPVVKNPEKLELWEIELILNKCEKNDKGIRDKILIELLLETNISINDALRIKISDLELNSFKNLLVDSFEKIELSEEIQNKIKDYISFNRDKIIEDNSDYLFFGLSRQSFRARFIALGEKAGIERTVSPNMLRNTLKNLKKIEEESNINISNSEIKKKYFQIGIGDD